MTDRPVLVAPDSFKGTFRATEVAAAIGRGLESAGLAPPDLCPVADGGDGTMEVLLTALGGETDAARVEDPLGRITDREMIPKNLFGREVRYDHRIGDFMPRLGPCRRRGCNI